MAGVAFAVEGDGVGFATESYAASALCTTLASLSGALWRIRRARSFSLPLIKEKGRPGAPFSPCLLDHLNDAVATGIHQHQTVIHDSNDTWLRRIPSALHSMSLRWRQISASPKRTAPSLPLREIQEFGTAGTSGFDASNGIVSDDLGRS
jgi:hypothetical protein